MKLSIESTGIAMRSGFVAPTYSWATAGVCPQSAFRRVDALNPATPATVHGAGMGVGRRSWSPLIT